MSEKTVSIIIPCYNGGRFLPEAIESALAQTHPKPHIIVVDDGSTDNSALIASRYSGLRVVHQANQGLSGARNTGLRECSTDYVLFLDSDDRLLPDACKIGTLCLNAHPECAFVYGLCRLIGPEGKPLPDRLQWNIARSPYQNNLTYEMLLRQTSIGQLGTAMFRRNVFESVGAFDPSLLWMQDNELCLRVARTCPIYCHNQVVIEYRQHDQNKVRNSAQMLLYGLHVFDAQRQFTRCNADYELARLRGRQTWRRHWGVQVPFQVVRNVRTRRFPQAFKAACIGLRYYPQGFLGFPRVILSRLLNRKNNKHQAHVPA
jgi:glycosyltransferase involved in cell wall biosynthesis